MRQKFSTMNCGVKMLVAEEYTKNPRRASRARSEVNPAADLDGLSGAGWRLTG